MKRTNPKAEKVDTINDVKQFFQEKLAPHSLVSRWNEVREEAKKRFPKHLINQLDASGFIHEFNIKRN